MLKSQDQDVQSSFVKNTPQIYHQKIVAPDGKIQEQDLLNQRKWEQKQNLIFSVFLYCHRHIFQSEYRRRSVKIYKMLSRYLKNRTADQCRSHYQKIILKFKSISKLKTYYRRLFGEKAYAEQLKRVNQYSQINFENYKQTKSNKQAQAKEVGIQTQNFLNTSNQSYPQFYHQNDFHHPFSAIHIKLFEEMSFMLQKLDSYRSCICLN